MIARGDLAAEYGYERLAELQEHIMLAEAAHLPLMWGYSGIGETSETAGPTGPKSQMPPHERERAGCVKLNKGLHITQAIQARDNILQRTQGHQQKKRLAARLALETIKATFPMPAPYLPQFRPEPCLYSETYKFVLFSVSYSSADGVFSRSEATLDMPAAR